MFHVKLKYIKVGIAIICLVFGNNTYAKKNHVNPNRDYEIEANQCLEENQGLSITLYFFDGDATSLTDWQKCLLRETVDELKEIGEENYYIKGHISEKDNTKNKYKLSKRRAIWLSHILKSYGAKANFVTIGKGASEQVIKVEDEKWQEKLNNGMEISTTK